LSYALTIAVEMDISRQRWHGVIPVILVAIWGQHSRFALMRLSSSTSPQPRR